MFRKLAQLSVFFALFTATCFADSFSFSASGSGTLPNEGYYYFYVYQYVYHYNQEVKSESHNMSFSGALSDDSDPKLLGMTDSWLIYEGKKHLIAIPCKSGEKIYVKSNKSLSAPSGKEWTAISAPVK